MNDAMLKNTPEEKKRNKNRFLLPIIIVGGLVTALSVLVLTGFLYVGVKTPSQKVIVQTTVCSNEAMIENINEYINPVLENDEASVDYVSIIEEIKQQKNYDNDATCAVALTYFYYRLSDLTEMGNYVDRLKQLSDQGVFPSNKLQLAWNVATVQENLRLLSE